MAASQIQRLRACQGVSLVVGTVIAVAVLLGSPGAGAAAPATSGARLLAGSELRGERTLLTSLAPRLSSYELELSSLQTELAGIDAAPPIAATGVRIRFAAGRASVATSSMPASVAALVSTTRALVGPARRALSDLDAAIKGGAFTSIGGIASAASQIARLLNPTRVPISALKREVSVIIRQLAAVLPPVSLAVGPGQPVGTCPPSKNPIDCWVLQGDDGANLSNWLGGANLVASIVGLIAGVGEVPSFGLDTPLTIGSDVVGTGTSVAQFYVDLVRRAGYGDSVLDKVVTAFMDSASVGTSIFDLGLLGDSLRLKAASEVVEEAAPTLVEVVDALHKVIPAGEDIDKGIALVDLIAKLRDAKTVLEADTQAKTIVSVLLAIITAYSGPESSWLDGLARYLAKRVTAALGSTAPAHHSTEVYFLASNSSGGFVSGGESSMPQYLVRPVRLSPVGSNPPSAEDLNSWQHWGAPSTTARGTLGYDTCQPDCAGGYHLTSGSANLSQIQRCAAKLEYTELRFVYFEEPRYDVTFRLNCEGKITSFK